MRWPKPIKQFFADVWHETSPRIIGKANRGGGKTQVLGALGFSKFYFQGRDIVNMGGSMVQAQNVYDRFYEHCFIHESIHGSFPKEPLMSYTQSDLGNYYKAIPASARQARGPHPDALIIDEVAEANDEIVESAMPMVNTSEHSLIVMTSTFHKVFGIFQECVLPGEIVLTGSGLRAIETVQAGDTVMNKDGRFVAVSRAWSKQLEGQEVHIIPRGFGHGFKVTGNHPVLLASGEWELAKNIKRGDYLFFPRLKHREDLPNIIELKARHVWNRVIERECEALPLDEDFYRWLGYWLGDGSNSKRLITHSLGKYDNFGEEYDALVNKMFNRKVTTCTEKDGVIEKSFGHKRMIEWIEANCRDEHRHKTVPTWLIERASNSELENFLIGLFRTDGHLRKVSMTYFSAYGALAQAVYLALLKLGIPASIHQSKYKTGGYEVNVCSFEANRLVKLCFGADVSFGVARGVHVLPDHFEVKVRDVSIREFSGKVFDLTVPDGQSFAMPWSIAHNTWDNAQTLGYQRHSWDAVDVARQFSPDIWQDKELRRKVPDIDKLEERFRGRTGDPEGWIPVGNIIQAWREKRTINWFDVEYMGLRPSSQGLILDPEHVEDATVMDFEYQYEFPAVVVAGLDWGFSSMSAFVALMQTVNGVKAQIDARWWTETELGDENKPDTIIYDICKSVKKNGIRIIYADSAGKFENVALRAAFSRLHIPCTIIEVPFSTEKEWMLGNYKAHFEQRKILIPHTDALCLWQHKRYRYQPNSDKPLKKDDHFPDATMLCMKHWPLGRDIPNTDSVNLDKKIHNAQSTYTGELLDKEF